MNNPLTRSSNAFVDSFHFSDKALRRIAIKPLLVLAAISLSWASACAAKGHPKTSGWGPLFTDDLSNVELTEGGWEQKKGALVAQDHFTIWTKKS